MLERKQIAALAPARRAELLAVQREMERLRRDRLILCRRMDRQQPVGLAGFLLGRAEFEQQLVARQVLSLQFAQALDQLPQPTPPHRLFLVAPGSAARQNVGLLSCSTSLTRTLSRTSSQGLAASAFSSFVSRPRGVPTR